MPLYDSWPLPGADFPTKFTEEVTDGKDTLSWVNELFHFFTLLHNSVVVYCYHYYYNCTGSKWTHSNITYFIRNYSENIGQHMDKRRVKSDIRMALDVWSKHSPLTFTGIKSESVCQHYMILNIRYNVFFSIV